VSLVGVLAHVLDQAHARKLFHHALKPTNVFVGQGHQGYGVRVTDFGAGLSRAAVPTQEGYALAAPWLAPEQVQGTLPAGAAADVFAAALIMFFALTGRSYWRSCQSNLDLPGWQRELMSPRTPPSARARELGVTLDSAFDGVLGCALSADPGQRYRSVRELGQAFEALLAAPSPEGQSTMAFPAAAFHPPGGGAYPPPPAPMGGYQAAPGPGVLPGGGAQAPVYGGQAPAGYDPQAPYGAPPQEPPQASNPYGVQAPYGAPGQEQPSAQAPSAYVSMQTSSPSGQLGETAAGRPVDPAIAPRRASPNRLAPILVGLVAFLLLAGAAVAWVVMGKRGRPDTATAAAASALASASAAAAAAIPPAAPTDSAPTDGRTPADGAPNDAAAPADSAPEAGAGSSPVESTIACDPECDQIKVDDQAIELGKPLALAPGKHTVVASKDGYLTIKETVKVKDGEKVEKTYKLKEKPAAAAVPAQAPAPAPAPAGPSKPCGKFLKRCK
jgi:hypothetical protein